MLLRNLQCPPKDYFYHFFEISIIVMRNIKPKGSKTRTYFFPIEIWVGFISTDLNAANHNSIGQALKECGPLKMIGTLSSSSSCSVSLLLWYGALSINTIWLLLQPGLCSSSFFTRCFMKSIITDELLLVYNREKNKAPLVSKAAIIEILGITYI